jgi:hypothetical protein
MHTNETKITEYHRVRPYAGHHLQLIEKSRVNRLRFCRQQSNRSQCVDDVVDTPDHNVHTPASKIIFPEISKKEKKIK